MPLSLTPLYSGYIRADEAPTLFGSVSGTAADATYNLNWLVDGRPGRPMRCSSSSAAWSITCTASSEIGAVIFWNHNLAPGVVVTLGGALSGSYTVPALPGDGINFGHAIILTTPVTTGSFSVGISSNTTNIIMGQIFAGKLRILSRPFQPGTTRGYTGDAIATDAVYDSTQPFDYGTEADTLQTTVIVKDAELESLENWRLSSRNNNRPVGLIQNLTKQRASLVKFNTFTQRRNGRENVEVSIDVTEYRRRRW